MQSSVCNRILPVKPGSLGYDVSMIDMALREQVAQANADLVKAGLVTLSFGNVSGLDREANALVIKPSGVACDRVQPQDLVVVSLEDGRVLEESTFSLALSCSSCTAATTA